MHNVEEQSYEMVPQEQIDAELQGLPGDNRYMTPIDLVAEDEQYTRCNTCTYPFSRHPGGAIDLRDVRKHKAQCQLEGLMPRGTRDHELEQLTSRRERNFRLHADRSRDIQNTIGVLEMQEII